MLLQQIRRKRPDFNRMQALVKQGVVICRKSRGEKPSIIILLDATGCCLKPTCSKGVFWNLWGWDHVQEITSDDPRWPKSVRNHYQVYAAKPSV